MADDTNLTIVGNLTEDPSLRYTPSGVPVASLTVASTPRYYDKQASEWKDGETIFMRGTAWRELAENASESLRKGMRVIAQGRLQARSFETRDGDKRTAWELQIDELGASLRKAVAQVQKTTKQATQSQPGGFGSGQQPQPDAWSQPQPAQDGWGTPQNSQPAAWDDGGNEPPF